MLATGAAVMGEPATAALLEVGRPPTVGVLTSTRTFCGPGHVDVTTTAARETPHAYGAQPRLDLLELHLACCGTMGATKGARDTVKQADHVRSEFGIGEVAAIQMQTGVEGPIADLGARWIHFHVEAIAQVAQDPLADGHHPRETPMLGHRFVNEDRHGGGTGA